MSRADLRARSIKEASQDARRLARASREIVNRYSARPAPGSQAEAEATDRSFGDPLWDDQPLATCDLYAVLLLLTAVDHLEVMAGALVEHQAATITIGRGCLEAAAKAAYLADPGMPLAERVRRWFNELLLGVHEQAVALDGYDFGDDADEKRTWLAEAMAAASRISAWGEVVVPKRPHIAPHVGAARPTISSLIDQILEVPDGRRFGRAVYRINSAVAHANAHGFSVSGLVSVDHQGVASYPADPLAPHEVVVRHLPTVGGFYNAALRVNARMGWDDRILRRHAMKAFERWERMGLS